MTYLNIGARSTVAWHQSARLLPREGYNYYCRAP